jgi:hypothetical protein
VALTLEKKKELRKTVAGGALNTTRLTKALPETTNLSLDFYLLTQPLFKLVCCTDPDVTTVEQWKAKAKVYSGELEDLVGRLKALAA